MPPPTTLPAQRQPSFNDFMKTGALSRAEASEQRPASAAAVPSEASARFGPHMIKQPLALHFLGCRGSGKSTQAKMAAERLNLLHVAAGDLTRAGKLPFLELRKIVDENFGPSSPKPAKYKGVVLDRFVGYCEQDVYYLQWALGDAFSIPRTFLLELDWEKGLARAAARADDKPKSDIRRMMEHKAHYDSCTNFYKPVGCLSCIPCDPENESSSEKTAQEIHEIIMSRLEQAIASGHAYIPARNLPAAFFDKTIASMNLVSDFSKFNQLKADIAAATQAHFVDAAPVSSMSGIVDGRRINNDKVHRREFTTCHATPKADGQRLIVVKHKNFGILGLPQMWGCAYDLKVHFAGFQWPALTEEQLTASASLDVEFVLDCEVVRVKPSEPPVVFVFDYIYFYGKRGQDYIFPERLADLRNYAAKFAPRSSPKIFEIKEYVPLNELRKLLPDLQSAPFPVDGIVFQHSGKYKVGADKLLYKWKPLEKCTVDYRLFCIDETDDENIYKAMVGVGKEEQEMDKVQVRIKKIVAERENIADGSIVECIKRKGSAVPSIWTFYKTRSDKLYPNKKEIADAINSAEHMTYEQLLAFCDTVKPVF